MKTANTRNSPAIIVSIRKSGHTNLNHFSNGTIAIPRMAINTPLVGMIMFENPSPDVKANTAVWRVIPNKSAKGTINGIETIACPEAEGIKKFNSVWKKYIPSTAIIFGICCSIVDA